MLPGGTELVPSVGDDWSVVGVGLANPTTDIVNDC